MNIRNQEHAERVLAHLQTEEQQGQRIRCAWINERQQFIAHYIGKPEPQGYGQTSLAAITMLMERVKQS